MLRASDARSLPKPRQPSGTDPGSGRRPVPVPPDTESLPPAPALARTPGASSRSSSMASLLYRAPLGRPVSPEVPPPHQADLVPRPALLGQVPGAQRTVPRAARVRMAGPQPRLGSRPYRRTMNIPSARCLLVGPRHAARWPARIRPSRADSGSPPANPQSESAPEPKFSVPRTTPPVAHASSPGFQVTTEPLRGTSGQFQPQSKSLVYLFKPRRPRQAPRHA